MHVSRRVGLREISPGHVEGHDWGGFRSWREYAAGTREGCGAFGLGVGVAILRRLLLSGAERDAWRGAIGGTLCLVYPRLLSDSISGSQVFEKYIGTGFGRSDISTE